MREFLLFLPPFLLALALRLSLVRLGLPFWYDEIWSANFAAFAMPLGEVLRILREQDSHPPLAYLLFRLWAEVWGLRDPLAHRDPGVEAGLRLLSALLGAGTAGLTALLARSLGASPWTSLLAGLLYALAPAALMREAEVHVYPAAAFLGALALLFWARRRFLAFAFAASLALHAHYLLGLLLLVPALTFGPKGLLPYLLLLPWALYAVPKQAASLPEKSPFNPMPEDALPQMAAFAHTPEGALLGVGAGLWLLALLAALRPQSRLPGLALLAFLGLWLLALPAATGFNPFSVRYVTLPLPLVLAAGALFLTAPRIRTAPLVLALPLAAWSLALPLTARDYLGFRSPSLLALSLAAAPGKVIASSRPLGAVAKHACRSCEVSLWDGDPASLRGAYLLVGVSSLEIAAGEYPKLLEVLREKGRLVGEQGRILLIKVEP